MHDNITINNLRCAIGQKKSGVDLGPDYLLPIFENKYPVNIVTMNTFDKFTDAYDLLYNINTYNFIVNIGGDHSIGAVTVQSQLDKHFDDILVIWIDAHADVNTMESSVTKNIHGMPVAPLLGLMDHWWKSTLVTSHHKLKPENLLYVGIRDLDPPEAKVIDKLDIKYFEKYSDQVCEWIKNHPATKIHISLDIDGINPEQMPSTGTPVNNGLTVEDVKKIINTSKNRLISFDLVEFNPTVGDDIQLLKTFNNCKSILDTIL
jgi:arginase